VRLNQRRGICRVARYRLQADAAQLFHRLAVLLDHDKRNAVLDQGFDDPPAHTAVRDNDDVTGQLRRVDRHRQLGERIGAMLEAACKRRACPQPRLRGPDGREDDRIERNGDQGAGQNGLWPSADSSPTPRRVRPG
jgi:hypothetical protein